MNAIEIMKGLQARCLRIRSSDRVLIFTFPYNKLEHLKKDVKT